MTKEALREVSGLLSTSDTDTTKIAEASAQIADENNALQAQLNAEIERRRHDPGWIGRIFGGQANAGTNIIGIVAAMAMLTIIGLSISGGDSTTILEVCKAIVFLSVGAFATKRLGS